MEAEETIWGAFYEIFDSGLPWDEKKFYLEKKNIVFALKVLATHPAQPVCLGDEEARQLGRSEDLRQHRSRPVADRCTADKRLRHTGHP